MPARKLDRVTRGMKRKGWMWWTRICECEYIFNENANTRLHFVSGWLSWTLSLSDPDRTETQQPTRLLWSGMKECLTANSAVTPACQLRASWLQIERKRGKKLGGGGDRSDGEWQTRRHDWVAISGTLLSTRPSTRDLGSQAPFIWHMSGIRL